MKKRLKKLPCLLFTFCLVFSSSIPTFAKNLGNEKITFSTNEITDMKVINSRLKSGITEDDNVKGNISFGNDIISGGNGQKLKLVSDNVKVTSQKVKETVNENGDKTIDYVAYVLADVHAVPLSNNTPTVSALSSGGGTEEPYGYDDSYSIQTFIKVTYQYNYFIRNTVEYNLFKFTGVSSKVVRLDSSVSLTKLVLKNSANGSYYSDSNANYFVGRGSLSSTKTFNYPSSGSYYSITPINYYYNTACGGTGVAFIRADATTYCARGGSPWNYTVSLVKTN